MRKVMFSAFLCLMFMSPVRAQYHITGDTIQYYDSIYWVPQWFKEWVNPINMPPNSLREIGNVGRFNGEVVMRHVADRPIRVIGIAGCVFSIRTGESVFPVDVIGPETGAQESFLIYRRKSTKDDVPARSVPWSPNIQHRYIDGQARNTMPPNCDSIIYGPPNVKRLYEVYFEDNPLVITDTFFIGMTQYSDTLVADGTDTIIPEIGGVMPYGFNCGRFPDLTYVITPYRNTAYVPAGQPVEQSSFYMWYFFPILSQDTNFSLLDSCPAAGHVWIDNMDGNSLLRWETDSLHTQWQVSIGDTSAAVGTPWLDTLVETPFLDLVALGIEPPFAVQVRPHCLCYEYYEVWGEWGNCVEILPPPEPDTCLPVEDIQYLCTGYGQGTLVWTTDSMHTLWQVTIGDTGTAPDDAWLDTLVSVPFLAVDSLGLTAAFTAHVRARCDGDNWSAWSASLSVDPFVGIAGADRGTPRTVLMPNPADGLVHATAPCALQGVEAYDLSGRKMLNLDAEGNEVSFDVSAWPTATYIVILRTAEGPSVHRLAVK